MNPITFVGVVVLTAGLLTFAITVLVRPTDSHPHLTVAELQDRLTKESTAAAPTQLADRPADGHEEPVAESLPEQHNRVE
ncbi:hypothetical protein AB0C34_24610 [Nocardia sp. NPDC049220]|uniref:hypothetical protein n=1 Tax=Nocardia sp. NPDC049220 TaxID=3155273 RepID=UPI0033C9E2CC